MFNARLTQDQIVMENVSFWFLQSYVSFQFLYLEMLINHI
jgi:hypothetical protein